MKTKTTFLLRTGLLCLAGILGMLVLLPPNAAALDVRLAWDANTEPDLAGYRVYLREEGRTFDYGQPEWEGVETNCAIRDLDEDTHYCFVVRAFDTVGNESADSLEMAMPILLLSPSEGSEVAAAPIFQWTPGPCDYYMFRALFYYPDIGYHVAEVWLLDDFLVMPSSWWDSVQAGHLCYWGVFGANSSSGHWEAPTYRTFTKVE